MSVEYINLSSDQWRALSLVKELEERVLELEKEIKWLKEQHEKSNRPST